VRNKQRNTNITSAVCSLVGRRSFLYFACTSSAIFVITCAETICNPRRWLCNSVPNLWNRIYHGDSITWHRNKFGTNQNPRQPATGILPSKASHHRAPPSSVILFYCCYYSKLHGSYYRAKVIQVTLVFVCALTHLKTEEVIGVSNVY
jgi:hypothetical protein